MMRQIITSIKRLTLIILATVFLFGCGSDKKTAESEATLNAASELSTEVSIQETLSSSAGSEEITETKSHTSYFDAVPLKGLPDTDQSHNVDELNKKKNLKISEGELLRRIAFVTEDIPDEEYSYTFYEESSNGNDWITACNGGCLWYADKENITAICKTGQDFDLSVYEDHILYNDSSGNNNSVSFEIKNGVPTRTSPQSEWWPFYSIDNVIVFDGQLSGKNERSKESVLLNSIKEKTDHVQYSYFDDFDGDGINEMFTAYPHVSEGNNEIDSVDIWFANSEKVVHVVDEETDYEGIEQPVIISISGKKWLVVYGGSGRGGINNAYSFAYTFDGTYIWRQKLPRIELGENREPYILMGDQGPYTDSNATLRIARYDIKSLDYVIERINGGPLSIKAFMSVPGAKDAIDRANMDLKKEFYIDESSQYVRIDSVNYFQNGYIFINYECWDCTEKEYYRQDNMWNEYRKKMESGEWSLDTRPDDLLYPRYFCARFKLNGDNYVEYIELYNDEYRNTVFEGREYPEFSVFLRNIDKASSEIDFGKGEIAWQKAYPEYLLKLSKTDFDCHEAQYCLININGDDIPELYVTWQSYEEYLDVHTHYQEIFSFNNSLVMEGLCSNWADTASEQTEFTRYIEGKNLYELESHVLMVMSDPYCYDYYAIGEEGEELVRSFSNCAGDSNEPDYGDAAGDNRAYYIDDKEVSMVKYNSEIKELRGIGKWKKFDDLQMMSWQEFLDTIID